MDHRTQSRQYRSRPSSYVGWTTRVRAGIILAASLALSGCFATTDSSYHPKSETEVAIGQINNEMLKRCEGVGAAPQNTVGSIVQDGVDIAAVAATCITRHNNLVDYLAPIVAKEKAK